MFSLKVFPAAVWLQADLDSRRRIAAIGEFLEKVYNQKRLHSSLDYRSPAGVRLYAFENGRRVGISQVVAGYSDDFTGKICGRNTPAGSVDSKACSCRAVAAPRPTPRLAPVTNAVRTCDYCLQMGIRGQKDVVCAGNHASV
jgi:hypothetical protein